MWVGRPFVHIWKVGRQHYGVDVIFAVRVYKHGRLNWFSLEMMGSKAASRLGTQGISPLCVRALARFVSDMQ